MIRRRAIAAFFLVLSASCTHQKPGHVAASSTPPPTPVTTATPRALPTPNVRGRDIHVRNESGGQGDHPAPTVLPAYPLDLVVGDCDGLHLPEVDNTLYDPNTETMELAWTDAGTLMNRTLTILLSSDGCSRFKPALP